MQSCRHIMCRRDRPESEMDKEDMDWRRAHFRCNIELSEKAEAMIGSTRDREHIQLSHKSMHLTVLRVCRQIYNEANNVLWTTNTFSFDDAAHTFDTFINPRTTHQKQLLRKLRLQTDWYYEDDKNWNRVLTMTLIRSLTGLRSLRLHINHSMKAAFYQEAKARGNALGLFQTRHLGFVHKLAILPLTDVEIYVIDFAQPQDGDEEIYDGDHFQPQDPGVLWTAEDKIEYAEGIREILLDPKGAEIFAKNQEELQEFRRQDKEKREKIQLAVKDASLSRLSELLATGAVHSLTTDPSTL